MLSWINSISHAEDTHTIKEALIMDIYVCFKRDWSLLCDVIENTYMCDLIPI